METFLHLAREKFYCYFSQLSYDQTNQKRRVTDSRFINERYGHYLSTDTPFITVGQVFSILQTLNVKHFLPKFSKALNMAHFCSAVKLNFGAQTTKFF